MIIEINPSIPVDVAFVQPADFSIKQGTGIKVMDQLTQEKGYVTVYVRGGNLIEVRADLVSQVMDPPPAIEEMTASEARIFFICYDRTILSNRSELPVHWHPTKATLGDLQILPKFLRKYTGDYSPVHWLVFGTLDYWRRFKRLLRGE